jgi:hypothetical protein
MFLLAPFANTLLDELLLTKHNSFLIDSDVRAKASHACSIEVMALCA